MAMNEQLAAAAEQLRHTSLLSDATANRAKLANWAASLLDPTPIDEARLVAYGFEDNAFARDHKRFAISKPEGLYVIAYATAGPKCWDYHLIVGSRCIENPTLGQLRLLAAALGIELKEPIA